MTDFLDPQAWRPDDSPVTYKDNDDKVVWRGDPSVHDDVVEVRRRWAVLRFFSWRYGTFLLGVWAYRDDDDEWNVEVGVGPLLHLHLTITDWPRPSGYSGRRLP